jgi:ABC-type branched-subunit amino acid transport system permease subunit
MTAEVRDVARRPAPASPGFRDRLRAFSDRHRSITVIVGMALVTSLLPLIVLLPPFNSFSGQTVWVDGFTIAGIYVLLALGLNIVVGLSGLLDLGYAAFFALGSYTFAFAASPFTGFDFPFWPMLLVGAVAAVFGILLGRHVRLRGDYLPS